MNNLTIEEIMKMDESDRIALIMRLAIFSEKKFLGKDIERVISSHHTGDYLQEALNGKRPKAW